MNYKDADEVLAVCAKATPGPWEMFQDKQIQDGYAFFEIISALPYWIAKAQDVEGYAGKVNGETNAQFIALSREALPFWVERARQLEAVAEAARTVLSMCMNVGDFRNGNTAYGMDEGEVMADAELRKLQAALAALEGGGI